MEGAENGVFLSVNGILTDGEETMGFHSSGMKIWNYAGGGNTWMLEEFDYPSFYLKSEVVSI